MGRHAKRIDYVIGPEGEQITLADLPVPGTMRWSPRRKAIVVAAVKGGLITLEEACARYKTILEEFLSWERALTQYGVPGLRVSEVQHHRREEEKV